ncbi:MAG: zinc-ribbon and DUF3426 domain-containing protein [Thiohalomonadales bacterium]
MFTQCPQCLTYFQVTPEHLKVAQGNVRCGQCQNVFSALGNLTELPPEAVTQLPAKTRSTSKKTLTSKINPFAKDLAKKPAANSSTGRRTMASKNIAPAAPAQRGLGAAIEAMKKLNKASTGLQTLADGRRTFINKLGDDTPQRPRNIAPKEKPRVLKAPAEKDITPLKKPETRKLTKLSATPAKKAPAKKPPAKKKAIKKKAKVAPMQPPMQPVIQPAKRAATSPKVQSPVASATAPAIQSRPNIGSPGREIAIAGKGKDIDLQKALLAIDDLDITGGNTPQKNNPLSADFFNPNLSSTQDAGQADIKIKPLGRPKPNPKALVAQPTPAVAAVSSNMSMQLIPKPLLADFQQAQSARMAPPREPRKINPWIVGCVVLMVIFLGQTVYFKHDDLAKNRAIRPWIESFCSQANCEVSLPFEIRKLELLGQDIRSHPKINKALLVSVTIINNARYVQAYPGLLITFTDMNDQKIAMRRFTPVEYLSAKTSIDSGMPTNTPVQVEIKLLDPGSKAVNFEFSFFNAG